MKKLLVTCIVLLLISISFVFAEERGLSLVVKNIDQYAKVGKQYAIIIAIDKYEEWNPLKGPVKDATNIKNVLKNHYYIDEFVELYDKDATKKNIIKLFADLQNKIEINDSVLIFYAGHGHLDNTSSTGFWIPVNGGTDKYDQVNWLPNQQVRGLINNLKSRHICLISDSCFAGDLLDTTRSSMPEITNDYYKKAYQRVSRQILTSGASETVADDSDFAKQLVFALEGNNKPIIDPLILFNEVKLGVRGQTPLFGELKSTGHQKGASFLLFKKINDSKTTGLKEDATINRVDTKVLTVKKDYAEVKSEKDFIKELNDILQSDMSKYSLIREYNKKVDKIKNDIEKKGFDSQLLEKKIVNTKKTLSLNKSILYITKERDNAGRTFGGYIAGGSVFMGLGVVSGIISGVMFGLEYDYNNKYLDADQHFKDVKNQDAKDEAIEYAEQVNNFAISGGVMISLTAIMAASGIIFYAIAPYDIKFKNKIDKVKREIENLNLTMEVASDKTQIAFSIKLD